MTPTPQLVTDNGTPVWITGTGPTVVLVHGVLMDHRMWAPQVTALSAHFRICCLDMLGHGGAPSAPGPRTLSDFVAQVDEVIDAVCPAGSEQHALPVLGGFSMGGLITQAYSCIHSDKLRGAIIMNAVYNRSPAQSDIVRQRSAEMVARGAPGAVASARERWFTADEHERLAAEIDEITGWIDDGDFTEKVKAHAVFSGSDGEVVGKLGNVQCPALVLTGEDDAGSTPAMAEQIAAAIPNAELAIFDGQRHMMPFLDAERVNARLLSFLRSLPG